MEVNLSWVIIIFFHLTSHGSEINQDPVRLRLGDLGGCSSANKNGFVAIRGTSQRLV